MFPTRISEKPQTLDSPGDCGPVLEERAGEQLYTLHSLSDQKEAAGGLLFHTALHHCESGQRIFLMN